MNTSAANEALGAARIVSSPARDAAHVGALDGVRGVAIALVMLFHMSRSVGIEYEYFGFAHKILTFGWSGVTLFFVLSGYLITGILLDSKGRPNYLKSFYARRALRIFPLYFLAVIVAMVMRASWPELGVYGNETYLWLWLYTSNIAQSLNDHASFGFLDHFWSLSIEEQFYLAWPFLVLALPRGALLRLALVGCVGALVLRGLMVLEGASALAIYVFTFARVDALLGGAVIAILWRSDMPRTSLVRGSKIAAALSIAGLLAIIGLTSHVSSDTASMQTLGHTFLVVLGAAVLVLSQATRLRGWLDIAPLRFLGKYSYGLYVWHAMVFVVLLHTDFGRNLRAALGLDSPLGALVPGLVVTAIIATASWRLVEAPMLRLKRRF